MKKTTRGLGFTLIEVLVAVTLMVMLVAVVTKIFMDTTELVAVSEARTTIYGNARYALDQMACDLRGCLSFSGGQQRFILQNGKTGLEGDKPALAKPESKGHHIKDAADFIRFRAVTRVGDTTQNAEISYHLIPGDRILPSSAVGLPDSLEAVTGLEDGDSARGKTVGKTSGGGSGTTVTGENGGERPLYTLVRRVRVQSKDINNQSKWDEIPKDSRNNEVPDQELAYFVISFNIEYPADDGSFTQIEPSPCGPEDPMGEASDSDSGTNDGSNGNSTALRIRAVRVTLVIVEDVKARGERLIQKVIWIPMG